LPEKTFASPPRSESPASSSRSKSLTCQFSTFTCSISDHFFRPPSLPLSSSFFPFANLVLISVAFLGLYRQLEGVTVVPLTAPPKAVHDPFKSGWDDTIKSAASLKKQTSFKPKAKMTPLRIPPPTLRFPSPTHSTSSAEDENDASFVASTQDYLLSPAGKQALGRVGMTIFSPRSQSAVDLDIHAESQQLIRKTLVSKVDTRKVDKHFRPPSQGFPATPETFTSFIPLPDLARPPPRDFLSPVDLPADRAPRKRDTLSMSSWPHPPTAIPHSPSPSPTRSPSRGTVTPSPTLYSPSTPTLKDGGRDSYYDYVRQSSPTFPKTTITNRDRAYIFSTPTLPTFTPPPPPRVSPTLQDPQVDIVPELKEVRTSKSPVLVSGKGRGGGSQASCTPVTGWNSDANADGNADVEANEVSPSASSFGMDSPSICSAHSGNQPHPAGMNVVKMTV
jgi:hypothetical protein